MAARLCFTRIIWEVLLGATAFECNMSIVHR